MREDKTEEIGATSTAGVYVCVCVCVCVCVGSPNTWKLMAQRETGELVIKARQLTSQHMPDELLNIQVTPCEEINCSSSRVRVCNISSPGKARGVGLIFN